MRWRLGGLVIAGMLAVAMPSTPALATTGVERIALVNHAGLPHAQLEHAVAVLSFQANHELRRYWPGPRIVLRSFRWRAPAGWTSLFLASARPPAGIQGFHDQGAHGGAYGIVYVRPWGANWTVGASHELLELIEDPIGDVVNAHYLQEVCDPVQWIWYRLRGVYVSDFVTPAWFGAGRGPWDFAGLLRGPFSYGRGGAIESEQSGTWRFVGPGAAARHNPPPIKLRWIRRRR